MVCTAKMRDRPRVLSLKWSLFLHPVPSGFGAAGSWSWDGLPLEAQPNERALQNRPSPQLCVCIGVGMFASF